MADPTMTIADPNERVRAIWERNTSRWQGDSWYDVPLHKHITYLHTVVHPLTTASSTGILSTSHFLMTVDKSMCNPLGMCHGGCTATVFDVLTSLALGALPNPEIMQGLSRTLNCTYLRPMPIGMKVVIGCDVVSASKRLAVIRGWMREWDDSAPESVGPVRMKGELLATCEHGKVRTNHQVKDEKPREGAKL